MKPNFVKGKGVIISISVFDCVSICSALTLFIIIFTADCKPISKALLKEADDDVKLGGIQRTQTGKPYSSIIEAILKEHDDDIKRAGIQRMETGQTYFKGVKNYRPNIRNPPSVRQNQTEFVSSNGQPFRNWLKPKVINSLEFQEPEPEPSSPKTEESTSIEQIKLENWTREVDDLKTLLHSTQNRNIQQIHSDDVKVKAFPDQSSITFPWDTLISDDFFPARSNLNYNSNFSRFTPPLVPRPRPALPAPGWHWTEGSIPKPRKVWGRWEPPPTVIPILRPSDIEELLKIKSTLPDISKMNKVSTGSSTTTYNSSKSDKSDMASLMYLLILLLLPIVICIRFGCCCGQVCKDKQGQGQRVQAGGSEVNPASQVVAMENQNQQQQNTETDAVENARLFRDRSSNSIRNGIRPLTVSGLNVPPPPPYEQIVLQVEKDYLPSYNEAMGMKIV